MLRRRKCWTKTGAWTSPRAALKTKQQIKFSEIYASIFCILLLWKKTVASWFLLIASAKSEPSSCANRNNFYLSFLCLIMFLCFSFFLDFRNKTSKERFLIEDGVPSTRPCPPLADHLIYPSSLLTGTPWERSLRCSDKQCNLCSENKMQSMPHLSYYKWHSLPCCCLPVIKTPFCTELRDRHWITMKHNLFSGLACCAAKRTKVSQLGLGSTSDAQKSNYEFLDLFEANFLCFLSFFNLLFVFNLPPVKEKWPN